MAKATTTITYDKKAKAIVVTIPYDGKPTSGTMSKSGKSYIVGTTNGFAEVDGSPDTRLRVNVNAISMLAKA